MVSETLSCTQSTTPRALTIAGSDSSAGAGIQADLKTFAALNVYGLSVLTAITAQNTLGVCAIEDVSPVLVGAQIDAVLEDIGTDAAKTGMLSNPAIIEVVVDRVRKWGGRLVVDPVMIATSGAPLLCPAAVTLLKTQLLPLAEVVTPNLPEAKILTGLQIETLDDMCTAAVAILALGARHVVVKGGHLGQEQSRVVASSSPMESIDIYFDGKRCVELRAERIQTVHTHGTGCTFSAAITALLARGLSVKEAVAGAKYYITGAISHAPSLGHGHGPLGHFWQWEQQYHAQHIL